MEFPDGILIGLALGAFLATAVMLPRAQPPDPDRALEIALFAYVEGEISPDELSAFADGEHPTCDDLIEALSIEVETCYDIDEYEPDGTPWQWISTEMTDGSSTIAWWRKR